MQSKAQAKAGTPAVTPRLAAGSFEHLTCWWMPPLAWLWLQACGTDGGERFKEFYWREEEREGVPWAEGRDNFFLNEVVATILSPLRLRVTALVPS